METDYYIRVACLMRLQLQYGMPNGSLSDKIDLLLRVPQHRPHCPEDIHYQNLSATRLP